MKAIVLVIQFTKRINPPKPTHLLNYFMRKSALKYFLVGFTIVTAMNSCVPLAIGAAGVAAGYIARDEGVGVAEPAGYGGFSDPAVY